MPLPKMRTVQHPCQGKASWEGGGRKEGGKSAHSIESDLGHLGRKTTQSKGLGGKQLLLMGVG